MALLDAIANNVTTVADGDLFYSAEDLTGSYQDGKVAASVLKAYVLATPLAVRGNGTAGAELRLPEDTDNGSNYVAIKAPDNLAATYTLTLPSDDGAADQYLKTDGSGGLSWATVSGASAPLTLAGGTVTDPSTPLTITQTWNDAADTFVAMDMTVTNTNSAAASRLLRLNYGSSGSEVSRFEVIPAGAIRLSDGTNSATIRQLTWSGSSYVATQAVGSSSYHSMITANVLCGYKWGAGDTDFDITARFGIDAVIIQRDLTIQWSNSTANVYTADTTLYRPAAGVIGVRGASTSAGGALNFLEQTAPSAPGSNQCVIYAEDNGSGKTRLMALFPTGVAQVLATEP